MCCHACPGYEVCKTRKNLREDDCCPQCRYFTSCMEEALEEEKKAPRRPSTRRT